MQVVGEVDDVVVLDGLGPRRPAVAAHVRREHVVAGRGERGHLVAPRVRQLGEAVDEDDRGVGVGGAVLDDVQLDAVRADRALCHASALLDLATRVARVGPYGTLPAVPAPEDPRRRGRWVGLSADDRRATRRRLLIDAAFALLGTEGWSGTTVRAVCEAAQLNARYFYESFDDLDSLVVAVYDQVARRAAPRTRRRPRRRAARHAVADAGRRRRHGQLRRRGPPSRAGAVHRGARQRGAQPAPHRRRARPDGVRRVRRRGTARCGARGRADRHDHRLGVRRRASARSSSPGSTGTSRSAASS